MTDFETLPLGATDAISAAVLLLSDEQRWLNEHPYSRSDASEVERMLWLDRSERVSATLRRLRQVRDSINA